MFDAVLDAHQFISDPALQSSTLAAAQSILGIPSSTVWSMLSDSEAQDFSTPVVLAQDLDQSELVNLQALGSSTIQIQSDFERYYPNGPVFSSVIGYVGRVSQDDLTADPKLTADDFVGEEWASSRNTTRSFRGRRASILNLRTRMEKCWERNSNLLPPSGRRSI